MKKKILISILILILILSVIYGKSALNYLRFIIAARPDFTKIEFYSDKYDEAIYLKKQVWGLTGDHQIIVISESPKAKFNDAIQKDYRYNGLSPFYYSFKHDTLTVYVRKISQVPQDFHSNIVVVQNELNNVEMHDLMEKYNELGLKEFSR